MMPWALVPAKRFDHAKSRLSALLAPAARETLAQGMFDRVVGQVLSNLTASGELAGTLVITDGEDVAARARTLGAEALVAPSARPDRTLGTIVDEGLTVLTGRGAEAVLVIMGDLPALSADDIRALAAMLDHDDLVLGPDDAGTGTNAMALRLPAPFKTRFRGGESLADHVAEARARGLRTALCTRPGLGFDVDRPEDYTRLRGA